MLRKFDPTNGRQTYYNFVKDHMNGMWSFFKIFGLNP
ncbi:MAG: hypothetical protein RL536_481 [Candidatus Parcubacteria bacterium]|jgi:hypothetical protein